MEIQFTSGQKAFVRQAIETGRLHCEEDAVQEAMALWEERERKRLAIIASVMQAEASLARGVGRTITSQEQLNSLASDIAQRGRVLLAAENTRQ